MILLLLGVVDPAVRARARRVSGVRGVVVARGVEGLGAFVRDRGVTHAAGRGPPPAGPLLAAGLRPVAAPRGSAAALQAALRGAGLRDPWIAARPGCDPRAEARADTPCEAPECLDCGLCCWSDNPRYVFVSASDLERLAPGEREPLTWSDGETRYMRVEGGRCAALRGATCTIYERRPDPCRAFPRGGVGCRAARMLGALEGRGPALAPADEPSGPPPSSTP